MSSSEEHARPRLISPEFHERVWGSRELEPWFPNPVSRIGEVWFREPDSEVLVKFLFTTENLSVQVHPDNLLARASGFARGKAEMWHILGADSSARIALGFIKRPTAEQVRRAAEDGSIMEMLRWIPVRAGDSFFIPAGAVHAIGAGISLCEIQQNSDVTYRLFDYGRGRELHIEESLRALNLDFEPELIDPNSRILADCPFFKVERVVSPEEIASARPDVVIALEGTGVLNGEPFAKGNVYRVEKGDAIRVGGNLRLLTVTTRT